MRVGPINKLKREIEGHKQVVASTSSLSAKTNAINCINRKRRMIKCWEAEESFFNQLNYPLSESERFSE